MHFSRAIQLAFVVVLGHAVCAQTTLAKPLTAKPAAAKPAAEKSVAAKPAAGAMPRALAAVSAPRIGSRIQFLADDTLEGRGTGARGAAIAARFIATEFAQDGLKPMGDDGCYLQHFELVGATTDAPTSLALATPKGKIDLENGKNCVLLTQQQQEQATFDAPLLFVGYGVTAPEMHWDDYAADTDLSGKVVVCLVNDPPGEDLAFFGGKALTYYGRWSYKYEEAARRHAAGVLLVHTDQSAGYGWQVVRNSWTGEQAQLPLESGEPALGLAGWLTQETAAQLLGDCGQSLPALIEAAGKPGFKPVPLTDAKLAGTLVSKVRRFQTENVAAVLPGSDPHKKNTYIVLTAHFDHLGIGNPDQDGDTIYNGAVDNGSGTAALLEIARAASDAGWRPERSLLFLAVTGEERGLLGSAYAAKHPPVPAASIACNFNMDVTSVHGETKDFTLLGLERTTLEPMIRGVPGAMNVKLSPDARPEQGSYFRSDHFSFAKAGVAAISVKPGKLYRGHSAAYGDSLFQDYNKNHYHQPSDEYDPKWDLSGTVQQCRFVMRLCDAVAKAPRLPRLEKGQSFGGVVSRHAPKPAGSN